MAVAVTIEQAQRVLSGLDRQSRALLHMSVGQGLTDEQIAARIMVDASDTARRVTAVLDRIADELGLETREQREELRATLPDLPQEAWSE